ncbi:MAG: peptidase S16 [Methylobacter sp.]|nr:MAG: peptidase S16 [Methylobacter sp.]
MSSTQPAEQPVFPLNTPLFPKCTLQLQIFEQRYLKMVSNCLRSGSDFTVCLLREGFEKQEVLSKADSTTQNAATFYAVGTSAKIIDFGQTPNGLLSISLQGGQRQRLAHIHQQADGLWLAQTEDLTETHTCKGEIPAIWARVLKSLSQHGIVTHSETELLSNPELAMNYFAMYAPLPSHLKQSLLEIDDLPLRWQRLQQFTAQHLIQA